MYPILSPAYRTDLLFAAFEGSIIHHEFYTCIHTSARPDYFWGNYLILHQNYSLGAKQAIHIYRTQFPKNHNRFITIGIDDEYQSHSFDRDMIESGFRIIRSEILECTIPLSAQNPGVECRVLVSDNDYQQWVDVHSNELWYLDSDSQIPFLEKERDSLRSMAEAGYGWRFGAFIDNKLVAELGIYHDKQGLGRFNSVSTHRDYRNRGICSYLLHFAAHYAQIQAGIEKFIIVADAEYFARTIYRKAGFQLIGYQIGYQWHNPEIYG
jgi:GNAT superfamily N-acetyltransferase